MTGKHITAKITGHQSPTQNDQRVDWTESWSNSSHGWWLEPNVNECGLHRVSFEWGSNGKLYIVQEKSFEFAARMVREYQRLTAVKEEFVLSKQLLKSGTSIGANIAEANGAISRADFSNKISTAHKECLEKEYRISQLGSTGFIEKSDYEDPFLKADEIGGILFSILKKTRRLGNTDEFSRLNCAQPPPGSSECNDDRSLIIDN